jgi:hypothetical protein
LESFHKEEGKGNTHKPRKGQEKSGIYDWSPCGMRSNISTFWSGRSRDTLSLEIYLFDIGNTTLVGLGWEDMVILPSSELTVAIYSIVRVRYMYVLHDR